MALYGELDWEDITKKLKRGARRKIVVNQQVLGGGDPPYGYKWDGFGKKRVLAVNEQEAPWVERIFTWYLRGDGTQKGSLGVMDIRRRLQAMGAPTPLKSSKSRKRRSDEWTLATIYRILRRSAYRGIYEHYQYHYVTVEGKRKLNRKQPDKSKVVGVPCPALVDEQLWDEVQRKLDKGRKLSPRSTRYEYLMGRRLVCQCGYHYTALSGSPTRGERKDGKERAPARLYYRCNFATTDRRETTDHSCSMPFIRSHIIDDAIWQWVRDNLMNSQWIGRILREEVNQQNEAQRELLSDIAHLRRQREETERTLGELAIMKAKRVMAEHILDREIGTLNDMLERITRELAELEPQVREPMSEDEIAALERWVEQYQRSLAGMTFTERREFIEWVDLTGIVMSKTVETTHGPQTQYCVKVKCKLKPEAFVALDLQASRPS